MPRTKLQAHNRRPRGVFITATDTGVGKTLVASALVTCLTQRGIDVGVMKPIETGISQSAKAQSDGARLRRAAGVDDSIAEVCPFVFSLPVAPLSAAKAEGKAVRVTTIMQAFHSLSQKHRLIVVEGIGGVYTPITSWFNALDLIYHMKSPAIVVGHTGLGGINHALLTLHALRRRKIHIVALCLNRPRPFRTKIARVQEQSTVHLLQRLAGVPVVGPLPYSPSVNRDWDKGVVRLAKTAPITTLTRLVLARMIRGCSSPFDLLRVPSPVEGRKPAGAKRDGHSET
jgi:dethiobiotin synthetase